MGMGFPLFHYYQHLPHVTLALVHVLTLGVFPLADMLNWTAYLLLSLFPLSIFWSLRRFGFDRLVAAMAWVARDLAVDAALYVHIRQAGKAKHVARLTLIDGLHEISMLDVILGHHLAKAIQAPTRLVLVGDPDQLPSVAAGNVLSDLLESGPPGGVTLRQERARKGAEC